MPTPGPRDTPRPAHFPFYEGGQGPLPWVPRAWCIPPAASFPIYDVPVVHMWWSEQPNWYVPGGRLFILFAGPPGLSPKTQVVMTWGSDVWPSGCCVYEPLALGSSYFITRC